MLFESGLKKARLCSHKIAMSLQFNGLWLLKNRLRSQRAPKSNEKQTHYRFTSTAVVDEYCFLGISWASTLRKQKMTTLKFPSPELISCLYLPSTLITFPVHDFELGRLDLPIFMTS